MPLGHLVGVVEDRRGVQPDAQEVRQEVLDVAEVDLQRGDEHRRPGGHHEHQEDQREQPQQRTADRQPGDGVHGDVDDQRRHEAHERGDHAASGSSARGNAVLRISRPPPVTDLTDSADRVRDEVVGEQPGQQVREEVRLAPARRAGCRRG